MVAHPSSLPPTRRADAPGSCQLRLDSRSWTDHHVYDRVGGMPFFERLVGRFYEGVATDPVLRPLYPEGTWPAPATADAVPRPVLGRPAHLRRRARQSAPADAPFPVRDRPAERDRWLVHMREAIDACAPPPDVAEALERYFANAAEAMRNRDWHAAPGRLAQPQRRARSSVADAVDEGTEATDPPATPEERGKTVHGEAANAGHRVLAPDDAEVEAYLEVALDAPAPDRTPGEDPHAPKPPDRRPRLRRPVRAADRAARPRAQRLLGAAPVRHAVAELSSAGRAA